MCGIIGMISKYVNGFWHDERDSFADMLLMNQVRGMDGTGVFGVYHNRQCATLKVGTNASNLVEMEQFDKFKGKILNNFWAAFGHNRKATQGSISSKNSHPFVRDNIVLIHNGTLFGHRSIADTEVDSDSIAVALNTKTPEDLLGEINGAYALVWYDKRDKLIRIARNIERPLYIAETEKSWMFSSESSIMLAAGTRNGIKFKDVESIETGTVFAFKNGKEYSHTKIKQKAKTYTYTPPTTYTNNNRYSTSGAFGFDEDDRCVIPFDTAVKKPPALPDYTKSNNFPVAAKVAVDKLFQTYPSDLPVPDADIVYVVEEIIPCTRIAPGGKNQVKGWEIKGKAGYREGMIDVLGFCSWPKDIEELEDILQFSRDDMGQRWVVGRVTDSGSTVCGPWVKCEDITCPDFMEVWNTKTLARPIWDYVVEHGVCNKCNSTILKHHAPFTSVNMGAHGKINKITCHKCVDDAVQLRKKEDETKDTPVQDQQQQHQAPFTVLH